MKPSLTFPSTFSLRAFGRDEPGFSELVLDILRRHLPDLEEAALSTRPSSQGSYLAVTITFVATSRAQLDAIYSDLSAEKRVLMAL